VLPGETTHTVESSFTLNGDTSDYGDAARGSIAAALASAASVSAASVSLDITAGSVIVAATIYVASASDASSKASTLANGIFASSSSLETTLNDQFTADGVSQNVTVSAINTAPTAAEDTPSNAGTLAGTLAGIVGGCFVPFLLCVVWLSGAFEKYGCPPPCKKKKAPKPTPTATAQVAL